MSEQQTDLSYVTRDEVATTLRNTKGKFYVYVLADPERKPFYVGKGSGDRVFQHEMEARGTIRKTHKLNVIRKLHREGKAILYALPGDFSDEVASLAFERELINTIGRHDLGTGPLTNQTDGGEGPSNPSEESRQRHLASLGGQAEDPERRLVNEFFNNIAGKQSSVPVKPLSSWKRIEPLRPNPKYKKPTIRSAKAIVASAIANNILLTAGVGIPRSLTIDGVTFLIENGCGRAMISTGLVRVPVPGNEPQNEVMELTLKGMRYVEEFFGKRRLVELGVWEP